MLLAQAYKPNLQSTFILIQSADSLKLQSHLSPFLFQLNEMPKSQSSPSDIISEPTNNIVSAFKNRNPKEDYQKNIAINIVKCCIRSILHRKYQQKLKKICHLREVDLNDLITFVQPILREVVLSLGNLKILLTNGNEKQLKIKRVFSEFLLWFLRHRYLKYLLLEGKMMVKDKYIDYKNKYILYFLQTVFEPNTSEFSQINEQKL